MSFYVFQGMSGNLQLLTLIRDGGRHLECTFERPSGSPVIISSSRTESLGSPSVVKPGYMILARQTSSWYACMRRVGVIKHKMDHLSCFIPAMLALGAHAGAVKDEKAKRYMQVCH